MKTNRSWWKVILLSIVTLGIYVIYFYTKVGADLNTAYPQGKKTMHYCLVFFIFSWLTCGIVPLVWMHRISEKTGKALQSFGINQDFGAGTFWLWSILGSLIVIGPFVYLHKLCTAMNLLGAAYNEGNGAPAKA